MQLDEQVNAAYPRRWIGKVIVETVQGAHHEAQVHEPKGDPGNSLDRLELEAEAIWLAEYRSGASAEEMRRVITRVWRLASERKITAFLMR